MSIVPWTCHICGRRFDTLAGGKCRQCGNITCNVCFALAKISALIRFTFPRPGVCRRCIKA